MQIFHIEIVCKIYIISVKNLTIINIKQLMCIMVNPNIEEFTSRPSILCTVIMCVCITNSLIILYRVSSMSPMSP